MKKMMFSTIAAIALSAASSAQAVPVDALSFLQMDYDFVIVGDSPFSGASPDGVTSSVSGPDFTLSINSQIDDPGAVTAIDQTNTQIGCASCEPAVPFISNRRLRTNRADPTEFSDAQWNVESTILQDEGVDVSSFAIGRQTIDRDGLAQLRVTSSPAAAEASSNYGISRVTTFENTTDEDISIALRGEIEGDLLARYSGDNGFARTSATQSIVFSGLSEGNLATLITGDTSETTETGDGATVTAGTFHSGDGIMGMLFSASATAVGDGGFTEAIFTVFHRVIFNLTIEAGQTIEMETAFSQANHVEYTPSPVSVVPLPAGFILLLSGIALLAGRRVVTKQVS